MPKTLIFIALAATMVPLAAAGGGQGQQGFAPQGQAQPPRHGCQQVGAGPVALTGMVSSLQASGPPGYGQTPKQDAVVQVPIMQLNPSVCVSGGPEGGQQNLASVQLVFQPGGPQFETAMTGTSFMASGTLAPAQGPEHLTPVVLLVQDIEQVMTPAPEHSAPQQPAPVQRMSPPAGAQSPPPTGPAPHTY